MISRAAIRTRPRSKRSAMPLVAWIALLSAAAPAAAQLLVYEPFDYVAGEAAKGLAQVAAQTGCPIAFGVLTTNSIEQAVERAGTKMGNKGAEAALVALEMVNPLSAIAPGVFRKLFEPRTPEHPN